MIGRRQKITGRFWAAIILFLATAILLISVSINLVSRLARRLMLASETSQMPSTPLKLETTIQIPEGWGVRDLARYLGKTGYWSEPDFLNTAGRPLIDYRDNKKLPEDKQLPTPSDFSEEFSFLNDKPEYYGLEGYLFPDTYRIYASSTPTQIIEKMLANFDEKLTSELRAEIKRQKKTIYEIVTMASIIEKEARVGYATGDNRDARIISGIFWNRLRIGQALQSDATLSYVLNDNNPAHSGVELETDSLYNTYKYRGLPPGPICNPGLLALEAAISPLETDYNYFLTDKDGQVFYAETYDEHLRNKYKYLK